MKPAVSRGELTFTLCIFVYVIILTFLSFTYTKGARIFPQMVIFPTLLFIILRLLSMKNPTLAGIVEPDSEEHEKIKPQRRAFREYQPQEYVKREFQVICWLAGLITAVYLVGIMPAVVLFVFLFVKLYGEKKMVATSAFTILFLAFIYVLFIVILKVKLYTGILKVPYAI